jgi:hypothetical protein
MKSIFNAAFGLAIMLGTTLASAAPTTLTFSTATSGASYTESGMTITATSAEPVRTNGATWYLDCCDAGPETFSLTTGGNFDLLSVLRGHVDSSDPIVWTGWLGGNVVAVNSFNSGQGLNFIFTGFTGLDLVTVSTSGNWTDPSFDNLTYQVSQNQVPEPATLALLGLGILGAALSKRRASAL